MDTTKLSDGVHDILLRARGHDAGPGSVSELHLKHLLALNLRKLGTAELGFVPRSYVLKDLDFEEEFQEFRRFSEDFKISRALALVKWVAQEGHATRQVPEVKDASRQAGRTEVEGLWGRELPDITWDDEEDEEDPEGLSDEILETSLSILEATLAQRRAVRGETRRPFDVSAADAQSWVRDVDWQRIRRVDWARTWNTSVGSEMMERCRSCVGSIMKEMPELQVTLLHRNIWALKPSCGQFGRGILLFDRLPLDPQQLLKWAAAVGRGGLKGGNDVKEGCVLQKLIEEPHLLHENLCANSFFASSLPATFKYNLRMIVLATLRDPCRLWLYREGFVSLAMSPFTPQLDPSSHITNLRQGSGYEKQRRWPIRDLDAYLLASGASSFDEMFRPQVKSVVCSLFHALSLKPTSLLTLDPDEASGRSAAGKKLRRFGFDFLIDKTGTLWLLEVNFLKNGYALGHAQSGPAGDAKRDFVQDFMAEETSLRTAIAGEQDKLPASFEELHLDDSLLTHAKSES
eukprot:g11197.t1